MKPIISILLSVILILPTISCGSNTQKSDITNDSVTTIDSINAPQKPSSVRVMMMGDIMMGSQCPWDNRYMGLPASSINKAMVMPESEINSMALAKIRSAPVKSSGTR